MKTKIRFIITILSSVVLLLTLPSCNAQPNQPAGSKSLAEEHNKSVVLQYFQEILDGKQYSQMPAVFNYDVVVHRSGGTTTYMDSIHAGFVAGLAPHTIQTTIHETIASADYVAVRLSHKMIFSTEKAFMQSRLGSFDVRGQTVEWEAMAIFRFKDGKIAEEWVSDDELGKLMQIGTLELTVKGQ